MDINNIPIKQDVNPVVDPRTQVSAEEFNCIVETVKVNNANRASTCERMGYVILNPDKAFADQVTRENTIYEIRDGFDLGGQPIEIPAGCVLKFEGGNLKNGTIKGNNTGIKALKTQIFDLSVGITGSFDTTTAYCEWFGGKVGEASQDKYIQKTIESFGRVDLLKGKYYIDNPIILTSYQIIQGCGQDLNGTELHKTTKNKAHNIDVTKTGVDLNQDAVILVVPSGTDPAGAGQYNQVQINDISLYGDLNNDYGIYASDGRYAYYNNIYIYGCKNGIRVEYSWMQLFTNVRMNTTYNTVNPFNDSIGFRINELSPYSGYTTINFRNCYAQFFHIGYKLHNCTYGAFDNCACDKCIDTAYYFSNNHAISINANGNEHTLLSDKEHSAAYYFSETEATMNACYSTMDGRAENVENKYLYRIINNSRVVMNNCMHTNDAGIKIKVDAYSLLTMIGERTILDDDSVFDVNSENSSVVHYYNGNIRRRGSANADVDVSTIITDLNFREKIPEATTYNPGLMPAYILPSENAPYGITDANDLQSGSYYVSGNLDNLPDERWGIITTVRTPTSKAGYQIFLCFTGNGAYVRNYGTSWSPWIQITVRADNYLNRPSDNLYAGHQFFCSDFHKPIWWDGTEWVESDGQPAGSQRTGTWAQRPNADGSFLDNGFQYFLLESTTGNGKPIWWSQGGSKWVDATGATVTG